MTAAGEFRITKDERVMLEHCADGGSLFNTKPYYLAKPMLEKGWLVDNGTGLVITPLGAQIARQLGIGKAQQARQDAGQKGMF